MRKSFLSFALFFLGAIASASASEFSPTGVFTPLQRDWYNLEVEQIDESQLVFTHQPNPNAIDTAYFNDPSGLPKGAFVLKKSGQNTYTGMVYDTYSCAEFRFIYMSDGNLLKEEKTYSYDSQRNCDRTKPMNRPAERFFKFVRVTQ